jgi:hypothetical protein
MKPTKGDIMLKLFRRRHTFVTVRAEDLEVGDRFVYDFTAVSVLSIVRDGMDEVSLTLKMIHPGSPYKQSRIVVIPNELLITVAR